MPARRQLIRQSNQLALRSTDIQLPNYKENFQGLCRS
jgi:hypothetical protein